MTPMLHVEKIYAYIDKISDYIEKQYGATSAIDATDSKDDKVTGFYSELTKFVKDVYSALNYSAIIGEYVDRPDFEDLIIHIRESMENLITLMPEDGGDKSDAMMRNIKCITGDLRYYSFEVHQFRKSIDSPAYQYVDFDIEYDFVEDKETSIDVYSEIFFRNLQLVYLDRELILNKKNFYSLVKISRRLEALKKKRNENCIDLLLAKSSLLLAKFNYIENIDELRQSYAYYNDRDVEVKFGEDIDNKYNIELTKKLRAIYTRDKAAYRFNIRQYYDRLKEGDYSTWATFIRCHYYKNILESRESLDQLISNFNDYRKELSIPFDKRNAAYCLNYLYNCRLSFILSNSDLDITTIWHERRRIEDIQDSTGIHNYFPFLKIAEWYHTFLSNRLRNITDIETFQSALDGMDRCVKRVDDYLRESQNNAGCFIPYKPLLAECCDEYELDGEKIPIFISTSFIVPVDYNKEYKRLEMLRESLIQFKAICDIQKSVFATIKDIDDKNTTLLASVNNLKQSVDIKLNSYKSSVQDELKENQKNNIQILAIFSGIVMFVSGSIQIFQHAESFKDAAMFMLLFAASLSLFALLIYALFSNGKQIKLLMLSVILAIILISCIGVFGWCDNIVGLLIKSQLVHIG
jgi:hypothetical protein